jgi:hypothetical protein
MWLRDFLPDDVRNIRIMTYGYNSSLVEHKSEEHFEEYRSDLLQAISNSRRTGEVCSQPLRVILQVHVLTNISTVVSRSQAAMTK